MLLNDVYWLEYTRILSTPSIIHSVQSIFSLQTHFLERRDSYWRDILEQDFYRFVNYKWRSQFYDISISVSCICFNCNLFLVSNWRASCASFTKWLVKQQEHNLFRCLFVDWFGTLGWHSELFYLLSREPIELKAFNRSWVSTPKCMAYRLSSRMQITPIKQLKPVCT